MTKKIFFLFAMIMAFAMPSAARAAAAPDSVFVVKNGLIVSAYEVGKDVDNISFPKKIKLDGNSVRIGDETVELKSALMMSQDEFVYVFLSAKDNVESLDDVRGDKYLQVAMTPSLLDEHITLSKFADEFGDGDMFSISFVDPKRLDDDDYNPVTLTVDDWSDYFSDGTIYMNMADDELTLNIDADPVEGGEAFAAQYKGEYTEMSQSQYYFTVDGKRSTLRSAFAEKVSDGIAFYLTSGNITSASELENCYYYARLFVPTRNMDGHDIDINGNREYELTFQDNATDINNPVTISLANGMTGNATGYVSVLDRNDGSYTVIIDVEGMGKGGDRSLQAYYRGTPAAYDLSQPSVYSLAGGDDVALKSAAVKHDEAAGIYTVYLSSKAGATTEAGMADADIIVTVPDGFANDGNFHGFSGTDENAKLSISYGGDPFSQSNTGNASSPIANGGNAKLTVADGKLDIDFTVFGIKKYSGSLKGHFEGKFTRF